MYIANIHIVKIITNGLKKGLAGGLTCEILGLKDSHFEGEIPAKFFAWVTCILWTYTHSLLSLSRSAISQRKQLRTKSPQKPYKPIVTS